MDHRRRNRSVDGKQVNVQRLKEYRAKLVVFPRNGKKLKKGWKTDSTPADASVVAQSFAHKTMAHVATVTREAPRKITKAEAEATVTRTLKAAWNDARLLGYREKRQKEKADKAAQEALKGDKAAK